MAPAAIKTDKQQQEANSFEATLDKIRSAFNQPDGMVDVDELWRVLESYKSDPKDWSQYAFYEECKYQRGLVDGDDRYNVMVMGWGPNAKSCIHDHSGSHCFMKVLDGELIETRFAWPDENKVSNSVHKEMDIQSNAELGLNEVQYITDKVGLHRIENPNPTQTAASIHVYIPPLRKCKAFDQRTGKAEDCKLTFYSKCGKLPTGTQGGNCLDC